MKHKKKRNLVARTVLFVITLVFLVGVMTIGLFYYVFSIPEPEGLSLTDWPQRFTNNFSVWTTYENGELNVEEIGLNRLDEYGLWIQFLNESGEEIFSYNKPSQYPTKYSTSELLAISTSDYQKGNTIFASNIQDTDNKYSYIIGFPYDIGKTEVFYNGQRVSRLSELGRALILLTFLTLMILAFLYMIWLSRNLSKVTDGIKNLSVRKYSRLKEKGVFSEIYVALNQMDHDLKRADQVRAETDRTRREWISNITHDLKTPLSPIKGYAELLADHSAKDAHEIQEYGKIIQKNVDHTEKLINDLKLTYQLESGSIPYNPKEVHIVRQMKEWVIDLMNNPAYSKRNMEFESSSPELLVRIDTDLFRRAVHNLIINALTHNPADTKIWIFVGPHQKKSVHISIRDNGTGMSAEELAHLFDRYYRGTNTKEKPEGSGLGLAIAKQIIELHGGKIRVHSKINEGTEFLIILPFSS